MKTPMSAEETQTLAGEINKLYGASFNPAGLIFHAKEKKKQKKIFIYTGKKIPKIPDEWVGLHLCTITEDGIDLSIEGAQIIGKTATKKITIPRAQAEEVMAGADTKAPEGTSDGMYILESEGMILGTGKVEGDVLLNRIPKSRRTRRQYDV